MHQRADNITSCRTSLISGELNTNNAKYYLNTDREQEGEEK